MKTKTVISTVLLLFVACSATYMVVNEVRSDSQTPVSQSGESHALPAGSKVVLYYFHVIMYMRKMAMNVQKGFKQLIVWKRELMLLIRN